MIPLLKTTAPPCAGQMLGAGDAGNAKSRNRTGSALVELTFQWSQGGRLQKVIKNTDCEIDNLVVTHVTEKINSIMRKWMGKGMGASSQGGQQVFRG